jgi:hypothetical protein
VDTQLGAEVAELVVEVDGPEPPGGIQIGVLTPGNDRVSQMTNRRNQENIQISLQLRKELEFWIVSDGRPYIVAMEVQVSPEVV